MVKQKIKDLKNLHNEKIGLLKKNYGKIDGTNIKEYMEDFKKIERLLGDQLNLIKDLESDYSYEEEGAELFEKHFSDTIDQVKSGFENEFDIIRKVTNPFYDSKTRHDKYLEFAKNYEIDLLQKKNLLERMSEKFNDIFSKKGKSAAEGKGEKEIIASEKVETIEEQDGKVTSHITEEKLIDSLKHTGEPKEEYELEKAIEDNNVKIMVEIKIVRNPDNTAWGFKYQRYYKIEEEEALKYKSGQIKEFGKLQKLKREYLEKLFSDLKEEILNTDTANDIIDKIKECLDKDDVNVY